MQLIQDQEDQEKKPEDAEIIFTEPNNSGESEPSEPNELREDEIKCDNCGKNVTRAAKCLETPSFANISLRFLTMQSSSRSKW